jgi:hypothetical protein
MEEDDIINNDFLINPREGVGLSGIATSAEPLLQQGSQLSDIQEVEPGAFVDRTSVTSVNDLFNYYYGGMPSQQPVTETPAVEAGAVTTPVVDTGVQDQATGDLGLDTTFQDAGATDVPGTIGTLGSLTEPTTQIAPTVNPLDEFGTAGDVYADVPPTTVNVPALDLSGTSEELIDQGVIETPQEFYERTYRTSTGESSAPEGIGPELTIDYDSLDQEEKNLVDQQYGIAYGLSPAVEPAPTLKDLPLPTIQLAVAAKDAYDDATAPSLSETIDFDTYADPGIDAKENQLTVGTNLQTTDTLDITEDPIPEIEPYADPDEITAGLTFETPAEQIIDQGDSSRDTDVQQSGTTSSGEGRDTDVQQSGTAPDFSGYDSGGYDPAPSPVDDPTDRGGGGGGSGGCFLKGTQVTMADGSTKAIEQVDLGDNVAKGGKVFATGKFLVENLHDYKGIKVSGSHMVNEDGNWVRVENSKHGKALGDDEHTVYVFGAENRRILINNILFTDYFEVNEQEKLSDGDKFFDNWKLHAKVDSDNNVNVLNAN